VQAPFGILVEKKPEKAKATLLEEETEHFFTGITWARSGPAGVAVQLAF
jgi:hypothetical protein